MLPLISQDDSGWSNAAEDRIELVEFDPSWSLQFLEEAAAIASALGSMGTFRIEHFGSTAIPGIRAKPVIDVLLVNPMPATWPALIEPLASLGYVYWKDNPRKDRMFFVKGMPPFGSRRTHHVHVRTPADAEPELLFRDLLRANSTIAREYELLKGRLGERCATDREAYTDGKTAFISSVLGRRGV